MSRQALDSALLGLQAIAAHTDDAMVSFALDGTVVGWNPAAERIFGYRAEEAIGSPISRLYPPEKSNELMEIFKRVGEEGCVKRLETVRRTKGGAHVHVAATLVPVKDEQGRIVGMASISRDITQQKQAQTALADEKEFVSTLLDTADALVIVLDEKARVLRFNRACERISGYRFAEIRDQQVWPMIPPEEEAKVRQVFEALLSAGSSNTFENDWVARDGSRRRITWANTPILGDGGSLKYVLSVGIDITERRRMEEALRASEERLRVVLRSLPMAVYTAKPFGDFAATWISDNVGGVTGFESRDFEAKPELWLSRLHPEDRDHVLEQVGNLLSQGSLATEYRWRHADGNYRWFLDQAILASEPAGESKEIVGTLLDITERKRTEDALRRGREELRSLTARLLGADEESRRLLARELHDDLSQHLAALAIDIGLLLRDLPRSRPALRERLEPLGGRVAQLSESVRSMSHQLHPAILDDLGLPAALERYCRDVSRRTNMLVSFRVKDATALTRETASCLYRVAQEALQNAGKHSRSKRVLVRLDGSRKGILLSVRDFGVGFDTASARGGEGGLGVISMEERVRIIKGHLSVRSKPGRGTRIRVWIPPDAGSQVRPAREG